MIMSYVNFINNRPKMDMPLSMCIWFSDRGIERIYSLFPHEDPILVIRNYLSDGILLSDVIRLI